MTSEAEVSRLRRPGQYEPIAYCTYDPSVAIICKAK